MTKQKAFLYFWGFVNKWRFEDDNGEFQPKLKQEHKKELMETIENSYFYCPNCAKKKWFYCVSNIIFDIEFNYYCVKCDMGFTIAGD